MNSLHLQLDVPGLAAALEALAIPRCFNARIARLIIEQVASVNGRAPELAQSLFHTSLIQMDAEQNWYLDPAVRDHVLASLASAPERLRGLARQVAQVAPVRSNGTLASLDLGWLEALGEETSGYEKLRQVFDRDDPEDAEYRRVLVRQISVVGPYLTRRGAVQGRGFAFILGMVKYRQRRYAEAQQYFSLVVRSPIRDLDQAISFHLLGHIRVHQGRRDAEAEQLYLESLEIGEELNVRFHVAQVKHSLANLLSRSRNRWAEAEQLYRGSLEILEEMHNHVGVAQVTLNLARLLLSWGGQARLAEAAELARQSVTLNQELGLWRFSERAEQVLLEIEEALRQVGDGE